MFHSTTPESLLFLKSTPPLSLTPLKKPQWISTFSLFLPLEIFAQWFYVSFKESRNRVSKREREKTRERKKERKSSEKEKERKIQVRKREKKIEWERERKNCVSEWEEKRESKNRARELLRFLKSILANFSHCSLRERWEWNF